MDYKPLYLSLGLILIIGVFLPIFISDFTDTENIPENSILNPLITLVGDGVSIFGFNLNIFGFFGDTIQESLVSYISIFAFIPNLLLIPLLIIIITGIVYTIIKMFPTT